MNPLSGVLEEAFAVYRRHAPHLLAIAFVIYLIAAVITAAVTLAGGIAGAVIAAIVAALAGFLVQAALVKAVQDVRDGRADLSLGETVSAAAPYIWTVAGASILAAIAIGIGLFLLIVPGLYLYTIWALIIPVIVIEQSGVFGSFGRSRRLVRGNGWGVFGRLVVLWIIQLVVELVLRIIFTALPVTLGSALSALLAGTFLAPLIALVVTLMYYRLSSVTSGAPGQAAGPYPGRGPYGTVGGPSDPGPAPYGPGTGPYSPGTGPYSPGTEPYP
jgi:hypothetical protein